ncbi:hypothetical protein RFI_01774 [Reticulomyxa filosa]|uniref:Uncharacterized protein n=1 Tax=Reticulomyxa filosa TaxID=46433 RepID=X6PB41_RETFI|nr:hypothetical protein RFI_01774 [Reticulomyxa filosa]|eukprot:ETO35289.1 hypothetical protein RFI_01774 [Reticulomyxa filosa]
MFNDFSEKLLLLEVTLEKKKELNKKFDELTSKLIQHKEKILRKIDNIVCEKSKEIDAVIEKARKQKLQIEQWNSSFNQILPTYNLSPIESTKSVLYLIKQMHDCINQDSNYVIYSGFFEKKK